MANSGSAGTTIEEITSVANGIRLVADSVNTTGMKSHFEFAAQFDGKDYTFKQSVDGETVTSNDDMVSAKKIDDYTLELTRTRQGTVLMVIKVVVSKDGKTITSTVTRHQSTDDDLREAVAASHARPL
jgi:hypothetical protein